MNKTNRNIILISSSLISCVFLVLLFYCYIQQTEYVYVESVGPRKIEFFPNTVLESRLWFIKDGQAQLFWSQSDGRSPNAFYLGKNMENAKEPVELDITYLVIEETLKNKQKRYRLQTEGSSRRFAYPSDSTFPLIKERTITSSFTDKEICKLEEGIEYVVFVIGNIHKNIKPTSSVKDYENIEKGNFLILTVKKLNKKNG